MNPYKPPTVPPTPLDESVLAAAVNSYLAINSQEGSVSAAAFGIACGELMQALNVNLTVAALLLRTELDRRDAAKPMGPPTPGHLR